MEIASDSNSASELEESLKETTPRVRGSGAIEFLSESDSCPELESSDDTRSSDSDIMSTINADTQCDSAYLPVQLGKTKPGRPRASDSESSPVCYETNDSNVLSECDSEFSLSDGSDSSDACLSDSDSCMSNAEFNMSKSHCITDTETVLTQKPAPAAKDRKTGPGRPRAPQGSAADTPRNAQRRRRARQKKLEDKLEKDWRAAVAQGDDTTAEALYQELLPTVRGRHLFPSQTKTLSELKTMKDLGENVKQLTRELGQRSKHRQHLTTRVCEGLPAKFCEDVLGISKAYLRKSRQRQREDPTSTAPLICEGRKDVDGRVRWTPEFEEAVASFFESRTEILSGAKTHTRRLLMSKLRLELEFEAHYPAMLRQLAELDPSLLPSSDSKRVLTMLQKNILSARHAAEASDFSESKEYNTRLSAGLERHVMDEVYQHLRKKGLVPERQQKETSPRTKYADFDVQEHTIGSISSSSFWEIIKRSGIKFTCTIKPHSCPLHDKGPVWELQLKKINAQMSSCSEDDPRYSQLKKRQRELKKKVARYVLHLKQYERCRDEVKLAEQALTFGDRKCVLYRDFVNCYNEAGQKCKNLVLVKVTRGQSGELVPEKLHNFCTDKLSGCDAYFVADVFKHHLQPKSKGGSGFFEDIQHITLSGDHGPHFSNIQTLWNESTFFSTYNKTVVLKFLCSYHAYNRCDGAGVCVKKEAEYAARNNCGPLSAEQYTALMNTSQHTDTYAFSFSTINRGVDVFPEKLNTMSGVRKFCDLTFLHANHNGEMSARTEGVVRARLVPGQGVYTVFDLLPRPKEWGRMCKVCTSANQRPIYHKREQSKCDPTIRAQHRAARNSARRETLQQPDQKRISGPQVARKRKAKNIEQEPVIPEMKMRVADIKAAPLDLGVSASLLVGKLKPALAKLLAQRRVHDQKEGGCEDSSSADQGEESREEDEKVEWLQPYDAFSEENFIEANDPVLLGWLTDGSGEQSATWSYAVAVEDFEGDKTEIKVHFHSYDTDSRTLLPSWVIPAELAAYLADHTHEQPPAELLAPNQPRGHVAYITTVDVDDILLAGPATAQLQSGFVTELQHRSLRGFLRLHDDVPCFGVNTSSICPGCIKAGLGQETRKRARRRRR